MPTMPPHYAIARAHSNVDTDRRLEFTIALRFWGCFTEQLAITQEFRRKQFSLHINLERTKKKIQLPEVIFGARVDATACSCRLAVVLRGGPQLVASIIAGTLGVM